MRIKPVPHVLVPTVCLGLLTPIASALTLGRVDGVPVLGRPLDLRVSVALDAGLGLDDLCPQVDLHYGDTRVDPRRVEVQAAVGADGAVLRVRSAAPLDEPFLAMAVQVGCAQRLGRRYLLLVEPPADTGSPAVVPALLPRVGEVVVADTPGATATAGAASGAASGPAIGIPTSAAKPGPALPVPAVAVPVVSPRIAQASAAGPVAAASPATRAASAPPPAASGPRLRLEPLDALPSRIAAGGATAAVAARMGAGPGAMDGTASGSPGAARAGVAQAEALLSVPDRVLLMEAELKGLREGMSRSQSAVAELRQRVDRAERERFANPLVYALAALSAALLAATAWLMRRARSQPAVAPGPWWDAHSGRTDPLAPPPAEAAPQASRSAPAPLSASSLIATGRAPAAAGAEPLPSAPTPGRGLPPEGRLVEAANLSSDEMGDVQQEADFFVALGEYDRAIDVLRHHIEQHPQSSAVAWLELLDIHHRLGRKEEYERLRHDFEWLFNAHMPAFEAFEDDPHGLEAHPALLQRIQALWPGPEVLDVIEAAVFRAPPDGGEVRPLGLRACRELLFLHKLASEMQLAAPGPGAREWRAPPGDPVSAALPAARALARAPLLAGRGLDVDLDDVLGQPAAATDSESAERPADGHPALDDAKPQPQDDGVDRLLDFEVDPGDEAMPLRRGQGRQA